MSPADYLISIRSATEDYSKTDLLFTYTILKERYARLQIPRLRVLTQATVDGVMWYTVECSPAVAKELRQTGAESFAGKFSALLPRPTLARELFESSYASS